MENDARQKALEQALDLLGLKHDERAMKTRMIQAYKNLFFAGWNSAVDYCNNVNAQQQGQSDSTENLEGV